MGVINREGALYMATGIDNSGLYSGLRQSEARIEEFRAYAEKAGLAIGGYFGVQGLSGFIKQIVDVRSEFQNTEAMFKVFLGSAEKAKSFMKEMEAYAFNNVFEFKDLTQQAAQLLAYGTEVENVTSVIDKLSNVAAGVNQPLERFVELYNKAKSRGKLDAVDVQQWSAMGDIVSYLADMLGKSRDETQALISTGKIGFKEMDQLLTNLTSSGGKFNGMMEEKMKTLGDSVGLLQDSLTSMFNQLGEKSEDYLRGGILLANDLVENYETIGEIILTLIATYGTYKAALVVLNILEKANMMVMRQAVLEKHLAAGANVKLTSTEAVQIASKKILTAQTLILTKALRAQAAAMLTNPAVLLTAAIVGVGYAMYKLATAATDAEKAQEKFNNRLEEQAQLAEESKRKIEELISIATNDVSATEDRIASISELIKKYPSIIQKYIDEKGHLTDIINLKREIAEEDRRIRVQSNVSEVEKITNELEKVKKKYEDAKNAGLASGQLMQSYLSEIRQLETSLNLSKQSVKEGEHISWLASLEKYSKEELEKELKLNRERYKAATEEEKKLIDQQNSALEYKIKNIADIKSLADQTKTARTEIVKLEQELADLRSGKTESSNYAKAIEDKAKELKDAESKLNLLLYGKSTNDLRSGESAADKARKQAQDIIDQEGKITQLLDKQAQDRARAVEDLENQASQARISAMEEGFDKEEKLRAHNNKLELLAIDRQKEDYIRAYIQAEREKFDAAEELALKKNPKYKKAIFDSSGIVVDTSVFNDIRKDIENKHASYPQLLAEQEAKDWDEYLIQFGSYQEKRQAIINKFNREMDDAQTQGQKEMFYENMQNQLDELDNSIKNSTTLMGQLFADSSQKSVTEIQAIIDKAKLLMQYIESVKDEQGNAIIGGKTISKNDILGLGISDQTLKNLNLSTQELEALRNAIYKLQGELGAKSPFLLLKSQISDATNKIEQGKIVQGVTEIGTASSHFSPAIAQFGKDLGNIIGDGKLGDDISKIAEGIGGLGETAAGVGQIMSGDIVGGSMAAVSGISKVVGAMEGLFGADYSRYNKMKEEYEKLNSIWDELIDKKKEYIKTSFGPEAYKVGKEAEELTKKAIDNYRILGRERLNAGASAGSHSIGIRQWKRVTREDLRQAEEALGDAWKKEYGEKGRMTWLFDLSANDLSNLKEAGTFWAHLDDDVRGYLDSIIDGQERINDINTSIQEQLTQVSFDSVRDSFIDTLLDMSSDAEDFADNFTQYMQRAILNAQIADLMDDELKKWYADFADANNNKGGMSDSDYTKLQNQWKDIVDKGLDIREKLKDAFDWEVSDDRTSTAKGVATASQDSVDYLNGMMTISVEHTRQILGFTGNIVEHLKQMNASHKEILGVCNYILEHTRNIDKNTADMRDDISKMRKDIFTLTQGITLKK